MTMPNTESQASPADQTGQQGGGTAREQIRGMKDQVVDQAKKYFPAGPRPGDFKSR